MRRPGRRPGRLEQAASPSDLRLSADVVAAVESMGYQRARGFMDDRPFLVGVVDYEGTDCTAHIHVLDADSAQAVGQRGLAAALCQGGRCRAGGDLRVMRLLELDQWDVTRLHPVPGTDPRPPSAAERRVPRECPANGVGVASVLGRGFSSGHRRLP